MYVHVCVYTGARTYMCVWGGGACLCCSMHACTGTPCYHSCLQVCAVLGDMHDCTYIAVACSTSRTVLSVLLPVVLCARHTSCTVSIHMFPGVS